MLFNATQCHLIDIYCTPGSPQSLLCRDFEDYINRTFGISVIKGYKNSIDFIPGFVIWKLFVRDLLYKFWAFLITSLTLWAFDWYWIWTKMNPSFPTIKSGPWIEPTVNEWKWRTVFWLLVCRSEDRPATASHCRPALRRALSRVSRGEPIGRRLVVVSTVVFVWRKHIFLWSGFASLRNSPKRRWSPPRIRGSKTFWLYSCDMTKAFRCSKRFGWELMTV